MGKELELLQKMDLTAENRQKLEALITEAKKTGKVSSKLLVETLDAVDATQEQTEQFYDVLEQAGIEIDVSDVLELIGSRIGNTLLLGGLGFVLLFVLALLLGALCAWKEDRPLDRILCKLGTVTSCIPEFWLSLMLILLFSVTLRWLPSSGAYSVGHADDVGDRIVHLILPMSVVVLSHLWYYAYLVRNRLVEELRADYVLLARSEGMGRAHIVLRQCLRNVLPSYLSLMAISVPHVMGGTYIVEAVFSYPGLGTLSYESARYKDYNLLMVLCLLSGAVVIACSLLAQAMNARLDPRLRPTEREVTSK